MEPPHWQTNGSFDPWTQSWTMLAPDGVTPYTAYLADVYLVQRSAVNQSIAQAMQVGAAVMLLITLLLVTKKEKLQSVVFVLNALALLFVILRGIVSLCISTGPLYDFYRYELSYYSNIGNARAVSAAGEAMTFFLTLAIQLSLVLQVKIVCCNLEAWKRHTITCLNGIAVFSSLAIRFALMALNIDWNIAHVESVTQAQFDTIGELASAANIALVISIGISAVIFCAKLWFAIRSRRSMGMTQFGPMQIIFVMGCQTMFTPFVFTIIVYWGVRHGQMISFVPTVVAISLPLSAMWATVNTSHARIATPHANPHAILIGNPNLDSGKFSKGSKGSTAAHDTLVDDDSVGSNSPEKDLRVRSTGSGNSVDVEMGRVSEGREARGVYVDRTYTVRSD